MNQKPKEPFIPPERHETVRKEIVSFLKEQALTVKEISGYVRISEKEVSAHLEHIKKSILRDNLKMVVDPATCKKCGFIFKKRERISKPGKCPLCKGESIEEPYYSIR
jgi:predicted Zn-ribbon and HTH transcriptional regulator